MDDNWKANDSPGNRDLKNLKNIRDQIQVGIAQWIVVFFDAC